MAEKVSPADRQILLKIAEVWETHAVEAERKQRKA
jgi:hypothetical protein